MRDRRPRAPDRADHRGSSTAAGRRSRGRRGGEIPVVISGDGLIGQVGGALAGTATRARRDPRRARQRLRPRRSGSPTEVDAAVAAARRRRSRARSTSARSTAGGSSCIASCGFDSDANRIANEAKLDQRQPRLRLRRAARAGGWRPARFTLTLDGERRELRGYSVAAANSQAYGGGMFVAPDAELDDGLLDVVTHRRGRQAALPANLPKVFKGKHVEQPEVGGRARGRGPDRGRPAVRRLRRRRPDRRPAGDGPRCCRAPCA